MREKLLLLFIFLFFAKISNAQVHVKGYTKKNGTYVAPHYRSSPNSTKSDNYSTKGNYNPYTGKAGTKNSGSNYYSSQPTYTAPSYESWSSYTVENFYQKIDLPSGTLDNEGNPIDHVYKEMETPKIGVYSINISDTDGELFEIIGTEIYVKFTTYHGYASYSEAGILSVESSYYTVYYQQP